MEMWGGGGGEERRELKELRSQLCHGKNRVCFFVCISLTADGPQRARLTIPPTATLPSCLAWGHERPSHLSPVLALYFFIAMQVQHSYSSSTNVRILLNSRSHAFRHGRNNTNSGSHKKRTHDCRTTRMCTWLQYLLDHSGDDRTKYERGANAHEQPPASDS